MVRLDEASERLQRAMIRLEAAIDERQADGNGQDGVDEKGAELEAALVAAKQEHADLQRVAGEVSDQIDRTVGRLKGLMAG